MTRNVALDSSPSPSQVQNIETLFLFLRTVSVMLQRIGLHLKFSTTVILHQLAATKHDFELVVLCDESGTARKRILQRL
jgi:hypothetical protein